MVQPIADVRDISRIAYGFMGSKALFSALNLDLFGRLADGPLTFGTLVEKTGVAPNRLKTMLAALTAVGLIVRDGDAYRNAPASERYLVRSAPAYFGDYYRFQIDRQIYPALLHLDAGLAGDTAHLAFDSLAGLTGDPAEADAFTRGQHAGSMGAALMLAKKLDLGAAGALLDVGGGSGAFSIALCQRAPALWFLHYLAGRIDGVSFSAATLAPQLEAHGFDDISDQVVIPEITKLVVCTKPADDTRGRH